MTMTKLEGAAAYAQPKTSLEQPVLQNQQNFINPLQQFQVPLGGMQPQMIQMMNPYSPFPLGYLPGSQGHPFIAPFGAPGVLNQYPLAALGGPG